MTRCVACGKRAVLTLTGQDGTRMTFTGATCWTCGTEMAELMLPETVRRTPIADHRTTWRSVRRAIMWAVIILAAPFIAGVLYELALMITQWTITPVDPWTGQTGK